MSTLLAYCVLAHKNVPQVIRLVDALASATIIAVHYDAKASAEDHRALQQATKDRDNVVLVPPIACRWGGMEIVRATISCMEAAVSRGVDFDRLTLLSGQDYPIKSQKMISEFFEDNSNVDFIETFHLAERNRWTEAGGRFQAEARIHQTHLRFRSRVFTIPFLRRELPSGLIACGGEQWWSLTRESVERILTLLQGRPEITRFFAKSWIPDEAFFQTVIATANPNFEHHNQSVTYSDWSRPTEGNPVVLKTQDLPALRQSTKLFARKFDTSADPLVLDAVDAELIRRP